MRRHSACTPCLCLADRGADEVVVGQPHPVPQRAELGGNFVGQLLRSFSRGLRRALNLLSVFVGAGEEVSIEAQHALPARNGVTRNRGIGVPDVRARIHVVDGRRDVKLLVHSGFYFQTESISGCDFKYPCSASCITLFSGTWCSTANFRQSSYSGA